MDKEILVIRHGESEANAGLASDRPDDIPLTERGQLQAIQIADSITTSPSLIVHSSFLRAKQTARPLIDKYPTVPVVTLEIHEFNCLSPTDFANTTMYDRKGAVTEFWSTCNPYLVHGKDAESYNSFGNRITSSLYYLLNSPAQKIVVFTHSQVIRMMWQFFITGNSTFDKESMLFFREKMGQLPVNNGEVFTVIRHVDQITITPSFKPKDSIGIPFWLR
jgi:probable phosphoglycerate mutase